MMKNLIRMMITAVLMLGVILVPTGTASAESDVINVPADYATIQAAVEAASPGDRIIVSAGSYSENVVVDKPVEIFGTPQAGTSVPTTYITALNPAQPVFILNADDIVIRWFNINNATATTAIYLYNTNGNVIVENYIRYNGIGILIGENSTDTAIGLNTFEYNTDALIIESGTDIIVSGNSFSNNTLHDIHLTETSSPFSYDIFENAFIQGGKCIDDAITGNPADGTVYWYNGQIVHGNYWGDYSNIEGSDYQVKNSSGITVNQDHLPLLQVPARGLWVHIEGPDTIIPDTIFTVRLVVDNVNNLSSAQYAITYDPEILDFESIDAGQLDGEAFGAVIGKTIPGRFNILQLVGLGTSTISGSGYLSEITFRAVGDQNTTSMIDFDKMMLTTTVGSSTIMPGIWTGHEITLVGDANGDGSVNVLDITMIARIILGYETATDGADANGDGKVNVSDIAKTARIILGLE